MYKKFISALTWNSINVFFYKIILLIHQIILFYFISNDLYGISGTLFAALYLLIGLTNFGFEYSLFTFFSYYCKNKKAFKNLLYQCALKIISTLITATIIYKSIIFLMFKVNSSHQFLTNFPINLLPYFITIFISESIRIYLDTIAQLAFLNKKVTIIQITTILIYVTIVWSSYFIYGQITLETIFLPMIIISFLEIILITLIILQWYKTLPTCTQSNNENTYHIKIITKEHIDNFINQLSKNLFSPNFLMILITFIINMKQVGIIRYFTNIITLLYMLFSKIIAIPSGALFSNMKNIDFAQTKKLFLKITNSYIQLLYILAIIVTTTLVPKIIDHAQPESTFIFLCFSLIIFIEYLTITYEKLFIVENATRPLAIINIISAFSCMLSLIIIPFFTFDTSMFLLPICFIKILSTLIISLYAYIKWNILPKLTPTKKSLFAGFIISAIINCFFIIKNHNIF